MNTEHHNLYEVLGLPRDAGQDLVKEQCIRLGDRYRPDKNSGDLRAALMFAQIEKAYQTLVDPIKRAAYDAELRSEAIAQEHAAVIGTVSASAKSASALTAASGGAEISFHSKINSWIALLFLLAVFKVLSDMLSKLAAKWLQTNNFDPLNVAFVGAVSGVFAAFVVTVMVGRLLAGIIPLWPPLSGILMTRGAAEITQGKRILATVAMLVLAPVVLTVGQVAESLQRKEAARVAAEETSSAVAEWISVAIADEPPSFIVYANRATIRRSGNLVKIWEIRNYTIPQVMITGETYLSAKQQKEYDCMEERQRSLFQAHSSEAMGIGNVVWMRSDPSGWIPNVPGSMGEITWKFACGKR